jgi:enoyl-CoA hydratase
MSEGKIVAVADGATGWLIFSNPERLNAVSYEMWRVIPRRIVEFVGDPAIRVVVLRGEGDKAFVSGADISQFEKVRSSDAGIADYDDVTRLASEAILACPKPTIAMIQGYCMGGGLGVAPCCDLRFAAAILALPFRRQGSGLATPMAASSGSSMSSGHRSPRRFSTRRGNSRRTRLFRWD